PRLLIPAPLRPDPVPLSLPDSLPISVAGRRGFERLYDLPERVMPATILDHPEVSENDAQQGLLLHAAVALGVGTEKDLRDYFRQDRKSTRLHSSHVKISYAVFC